MIRSDLHGNEPTGHWALGSGPLSDSVAQRRFAMRTKVGVMAVGLID